MDRGGYKEGELEQLHAHLYDILAKTIEVCDKLGINYALIGGSAIGAFFDGAILPWDDDVDLGMERHDYDRFLREAPQHLPEGYVVQSPENEPSTPYYFAKVRKSGTRFEAEDELDLPIHHGIYVDIFPLDRVPDNTLLERMQRWGVRMLHNSFVSTTIPLRDGGAVAKMIVVGMGHLVGKSRLYRAMRWLQTRYNNVDSKYVNIIKMPHDHIERTTINPPQRVKFGDMEINAPHKLRVYLESHYPNLRPVIPVEEQVNHAPIRLNFNGDE